jgi:hypothetical protein
LSAAKSTFRPHRPGVLLDGEDPLEEITARPVTLEIRPYAGFTAEKFLG